jgi:hypothetical protein
MSPKPLIGRLTDGRIRRLQNLGFVWSLRDDWQKHFDELKGKRVGSLLVLYHGSLDVRLE